jgi:hypothetical protein
VSNYREGACRACNQGTLDIDTCTCPRAYSQAELDAAVAAAKAEALAPVLALAAEWNEPYPVKAAKIREAVGRGLRSASEQP